MHQSAAELGENRAALAQARAELDGRAVQLSQREHIAEQVDARLNVRRRKIARWLRELRRVRRSFVERERQLKQLTGTLEQRESIVKSQEAAFAARDALLEIRERELLRSSRSFDSQAAAMLAWVASYQMHETPA